MIESDLKIQVKLKVEKKISQKIMSIPDISSATICVHPSHLYAMHSDT